MTEPRPISRLLEAVRSCSAGRPETRRRCRHRSRYGWPSAPRRCDPGEVRPPSGRSPVARMSGRRPRRTSASCVRRADVRPIGHADVRCPCVWCPRVRRNPGVRTDGPSVSAALQRAVRTALDLGLGAAGRPRWRMGSMCRRGPRAARSTARMGPEGKRWCWGWPWVARTRVDTRPGPPHRTRTGCGATSPPGRQGSWSSARVPVGWLESTRTSRCSPSPSRRCRPGQVAGVVPDHGLDREGDDHAPWSLGW
jgi:hypothetical protein